MCFHCRLDLLWLRNFSTVSRFILTSCVQCNHVLTRQSPTSRMQRRTLSSWFSCLQRPASPSCWTWWRCFMCCWGQDKDISSVQLRSQKLRRDTVSWLSCWPCGTPTLGSWVLQEKKNYVKMWSMAITVLVPQVKPSSQCCSWFDLLSSAQQCIRSLQITPPSRAANKLHPPQLFLSLCQITGHCRYQ